MYNTYIYEVILKVEIHLVILLVNLSNNNVWQFIYSNILITKPIMQKLLLKFSFTKYQFPDCFKIINFKINKFQDF